MCSKLTLKTQKQRDWRRFGVFIVDFEHYIKPFPNVWTFGFKQMFPGNDTQIRNSVYFYI